MPFISVVVPTYNNAHFIGDALASVLTQTFTDYELIVVDDGSTDDTKAIVATFGPGVRYVFQQNQGLAVARNSGLALAKGDFVTYLDADDVWERDNLLVKANVLFANRGIGGVFSDFSIFDETGVLSPRGTVGFFPFFKRTGRSFAQVFSASGSVSMPGGASTLVRHGNVFDSLFWGNFILPTSMVFSRAIAEVVGQFRPELRTQQDYEYWLRFARHHELAYVDEPLVRYRRHPSQLTDHSRIANILLAVNGIIDQYEGEFVAKGLSRQFARRKAGILTELAKVRVGAGQMDEARKLLRDGIGRDPFNVSAYVTLAITLLPGGMVDVLRRARR